MTRDPHSYADLEQARTRRVDLDLTVDFDRRVLHGTAHLHFEAPMAGPIDLDTRGLRIERIVDADWNEVHYTLLQPDPILGSRLRLHPSVPTGSVYITYETSPDASGLMWLEPAQTSGGRHPFLLSQCQAIHARSVAPLQDTPEMRVPYSATLRIPSWAHAVMSAAPGDVEEVDGMRVVRFEMPQRIPPYLLAIAVGVLDSRELGPRCRVFAEPEVVEAAAWEFADAEPMLEAAEALFGPYQWDRYDFIVLPASFPMGGMENPRMTFLTPTLLAGDRSLVGVLAHELAHSWTGNLVTNANNEHFWLNEGWTVWAERRILEQLYGEEEATQQAILGRIGLEETLRRRADTGQPTALTYDQKDVDPDADFSKVPYEKGFLLLTAIERAVGRARFDAFVAAYIERFAFQTLDTPAFTAFLNGQLPDHGIELAPWLHEDGLPDTAPRFTSERLDAIRRSARAGDAVDGAEWTTTEKLVYLAEVSDTVDAHAVAGWLGIDASSNAELQSAWLALGVRSGSEELGPHITTFLDTVGRTKLLTPVYRALVAQPDLQDFARARYAANRRRLHGSTRGAIEGLLP
jgi:aminopeptidase N